MVQGPDDGDDEQGEREGGEHRAGEVKRGDRRNGGRETGHDLQGSVRHHGHAPTFSSRRLKTGLPSRGFASRCPPPAVTCLPSLY